MQEYKTEKKLQEYTIRINYDSLPYKDFKYMAEINNKDFEAVEYISTNNKSDTHLSKLLKEFIYNL